MIHGDRGSNNESEEDDMIFVPNFRTVTRRGRLAEIWRNRLTQEPETSNEHQSDSDEHEIDNESEDSEMDHQTTVIHRVIMNQYTKVMIRILIKRLLIMKL